MAAVQTPDLSCLSALLERSVSSRPDDPAVGVSDQSLVLSYRALDANVREVADQLRQLGARHGDTIGIVSDNCVEFAIALLAVVSAGAAAAPVDSELPAAELAARLKALGATAAIVPGHLYDNVVGSHTDSDGPPAWKIVLESGEDGHPAAKVTASSAEAHAAAALGEAIAARRPGPDDTALLMLTTGSTAKPKKVPLSHANVAASITDICATYQLGPGDATLLVMPLYHGHGLIAGLLASLASGAAAYVPERGKFAAHAFWTEMVDIGATWYTAVPTMHQILLDRASDEYPKDHPPALRFVRSCSAPLAPEVLRAIESTFGAPAIEAYGMTETSHQTSSNPLPPAPRKGSSVGLGTGVEIRILGPDAKPVPPGEVGEVCVKGATVTAGYLDNPEANRDGFIDGWFRTGDLGLLDAQHYLFLKGRIKELINRGGEKIAPQKVDAVLLSDPKVEDALSFGVADPKYGEEINAAVVLKPGQTETEHELTDHCLASLSEAETPKKFHFLDELPKTAKGDGDRAKLAAKFGDTTA